MTAHKCAAWLVGNKPEDYCIGFVKGSEAHCNGAMMTLHETENESEIQLQASIPKQLVPPRSVVDVDRTTTNHIWYCVPLGDMSGAVVVGISQRRAFVLRGCLTKENCLKKHETGELNM